MLAILGIFALMILGFVFVTKMLARAQSGTTKVGASWHGLTIGVSTRDDVRSLYGSPNHFSILKLDADEYYIAQPPGNTPDMTFIYDSQDVLSFMYIDFRRTNMPYVLGFLQSYGSPQYQMRDVSSYKFLYVSQGIVFSTDPSASIVLDVYFMSPCSLDCTKKALGIIYPTTLEPYQTLTP
jgi:hypothetical protein